jgi:hypothetical protein
MTDNVNRPPDWRRVRAQELADTGKPFSRSRDDSAVRAATKYLRKAQQMNLRTDRIISKTMQAVSSVFQLYENNYAFVKWIIEAAVLADAPRDMLAYELNTSEKVIEMYELIFFDVRPYLDRYSWVMGGIIGPAMDKVKGDDPDGLWKWLAYHAGWDVFYKCVIRPGQMSAPIFDQIHVLIKGGVTRQMFYSATGHKPNAFNFIDALRMGYERMKVEEDQGGGGGQTVALESIKMVMASVELEVTSAAARLPAAEPRLQMTTPRDIIIEEADGE